MDGWIILDKPSGITSASAVNKVKRILAPPRRELKIGHAGTLDPLASGILPLALGEATKTISFMMDAAKAYAFTVTWGEERDTDDCEGKTITTSDKRPTIEEIEKILPQFIGTILQTPPIFSAIKVDGERAYDLARAGEAVELRAREVRVDSLVLLSSPLEGERARHSRAVEGMIEKLPPTASAAAFGFASATPPQGGSNFICHCGKGTYIRSLARDMGRALGCFGHISMLRRLKVGNFSEKDAISLANLEEIVHKGALSLLPVESALDDILALEIDSHQAAALKRGQPISVKQVVGNDIVLARHQGKAIAICKAAHGTMKPVRVFNL